MSIESDSIFFATESDAPPLAAPAVLATFEELRNIKTEYNNLNGVDQSLTKNLSPSEYRKFLQLRKAAKLPLQEAGKEQIANIHAHLKKRGDNLHPFTRAALEAAFIRGDPIFESDTLEIAFSLAGSLIQLNQLLENSGSQPIVAISHKIKSHEDYTQYGELKVNMGFTCAGQGLEIEYNNVVFGFGSQSLSRERHPYITFHVRQDDKNTRLNPMAIATPSWNSHYSSSDSRVRSVVVAKKGNKYRSRVYPKPTVDDFSLSLPTGALFMRYNRDLMVCDGPNGTQLAVEAPKDFSGRPDTVVRIGNRAIIQFFQEYSASMDAIEKGKVPHNNKYQPKYDPRVVKAMGRNVQAYVRAGSLLTDE